jgi:Phospholipase/Carboxylesterase
MKMPYAKFILPTAPTQPVTMNMGMSMPSWYVTIYGFSRLVTVSGLAMTIILESTSC